MPTPQSRKPRVFVDADVFFAGAAAPTEHGASLTVLRMAEIMLAEAALGVTMCYNTNQNI
jgi:hypothetical protein